MHRPRSTHLTTRQLAARWCLHPDTLKRWRRLGRGPAYIRVGRRILYPLPSVLTYENRSPRPPHYP